MNDEASLPGQSDSGAGVCGEKNVGQVADETPAFSSLAAAGGPADSEGIAPAEMPLPQVDGVSLVKAGNLAAAEVAFRRDLESAPDDPGVCHNLAVTLARQGKLTEAIEIVERSLRLKPDAAETHRNLALALCQQGNRLDGERHWREAVRIDPALGTAHHELGNSLRISGRLDEAACRAAAPRLTMTWVSRWPR